MELHFENIPLRHNSEPALPKSFGSKPAPFPDIFQSHSTPLPDVSKSQTAGNESAIIGEEPDLFPPNFDFPDSDFGSRSDSQTEIEKENPEQSASGRSFPSIADSISEEGRNANFFANPFQVKIQ